MSTAEPILSIQDLHIRVGERPEEAVAGVSLDIERGAFVSLVGESGSGKSLTALSVCRLLRTARLSGKILYSDGKASPVDLAALSERELIDHRGRRIAYIFQDPAAALNPVMRIGKLLTETLLCRGGLSEQQASKKALASLERVRLSDPRRVLASYPHELSGGMKQRVMIAAALLGEPSLLIADEPTTALDVTTESQIMALLEELRKERGLSIFFITHDLALARAFSSKITVLQAGRVVETLRTDGGVFRPQMDYTRRLFGANLQGIAAKMRIPL